MAKKKTTTTKNTKKKKVYDIVEHREDAGYDKQYTWYSFFNEFCTNNKTDIDENFQSPPRWPEQTKYRYLKSASKQFTKGSCIVVYDVEQGLSYCKRNYLQTDIEHLENWISKGVKYLVIDGNNKRWTIVGYIGNNLKLNFNLKYVGQTYEVRNKTFSDLQKDPNLFQVATWLSNLPIKVIVYTNISLTECGEMFVEINKGGVKLNAQEERNASYSYTAVQIRNLKDKFVKKINSRFTPAKYIEMNTRRGLDEQVAKCYLSGYSELTKFGGKPLNDMYEKDLLAQDKGKYELYSKLIEDAISIFILTDFKNSPGEILHIFNLLYTLNKSGYSLNYQYKNLYKDLARWYSEHSISNTATLIGRHMNQDASLQWLKTLAAKSSVQMINAFNYDMFLDNALCTNLYKVENNAKRIASRYQRYQCWKKQQKEETNAVTGQIELISRCPETNKVIPYHEIHDSLKWQAHHETRFADGGNDYVLIDAIKHLEITINQNKTAREFGTLNVEQNEMAEL
jgi:hypothetical protein